MNHFYSKCQFKRINLKRRAICIDQRNMVRNVPKKLGGKKQDLIKLNNNIVERII